MDSSQRNLVESKLSVMSQYLDELAFYLKTGLERYKSDRTSQLAIERLGQLIVECAIDINVLIVTESGNPPPSAARDGFRLIHRIGVVDENLLRKFEGTYIGFRHRIVHDYEKLDRNIVFYTAKNLLKDGKDYIKAVLAYLEKT